MKLRIALALAVAALAAVGVVALAGGSGGEAGAGGGDPRPRFAWSGTPQVDAPRYLPRDRVLSGKLRNESLRDVKLVANNIRIVDAAGRPVRSTARFLAAYTHGLYPPTQRPKTPNPNEQQQLGEIVTIKPQQVVPLTLSWRVPKGGKQPERVDFGGASLALP